MGEGPTPTARPLSTIPLFSLYCVFIPLKQTLDMQHVVHLNRNADSMSVEYPKKSEILSWALSLWRNMFYRIVILLFFTFQFRNPDMLIASFFIPTAAEPVLRHSCMTSLSGKKDTNMLPFNHHYLHQQIQSSIVHLAWVNILSFVDRRDTYSSGRIIPVNFKIAAAIFKCLNYHFLTQWPNPLLWSNLHETIWIINLWFNIIKRIGDSNNFMS